MPRLSLLMVVLFAPLALFAQETPARVAKALPDIEHVLVISIDGLRPDRALWAEMPHLRSLARKGAYSFWAYTTPNSITLPSHTSMLTGVSPRKHGIEWNADLPLFRNVYPGVPTVFELATQVGLDTALVAGKSKFKTLNKPGTIGRVRILEGERANDTAVADEVVALLRDRPPALLFAHFPDVDSYGHAKGWGSSEQLQAIEVVDRQLGRLLATLDETGLRTRTAVLISADHGGAGRSHGPDDPRSRHIPWILQGPGIAAGRDLTQDEELHVHTEDTAATVCALLGIPLPRWMEGKPVTAAWRP